MNLTLSREEDKCIRDAYVRYLLDSDEQLTRNKWIVKMIMERIENEVQ